MKLIIPCLVIFTAIPCVAQHRFELSDPSAAIAVTVDVATCDTDCHGPAKFSFTRKGSSKPFQIIRLPDTQIWLDDKGAAQANVTLRYDEQSAVNFGDFNFDRSEDVAICDGANGGYGMPSYQIYLYSPKLKRFIQSRPFTKINSGGLGMFEIDRKKKMLMVSSKSGCCWHRTEGFAIVGGQPKKVYEFTEDATRNEGKTVEITTRRLLNGKWRTAIKRAKTSEYYKN